MARKLDQRSRALRRNLRKTARKGTLSSRRRRTCSLKRVDSEKQLGEDDRLHSVFLCWQGWVLD